MSNTDNELDTRTVAQRLEARRASEELRNYWARVECERALQDQFSALFI